MASGLSCLIFAFVAFCSNFKTTVSIGDQYSSLDCSYRLIEKIVSFENKNAQLEKQVTSMERKNEELEIMMADQRQEIESLKTVLDDHKEKIDEGFKVNYWNWTKVAPAFLARLQSDNLKCTKNSNLLFKNVIMNSHYGYNPNDGQFRAPVRGRYIFSVTARAYGVGANNHATLRKNGHVIGFAVGGHGGNNWGTSGTASAVVDLDPNDIVYVNCESNEYYQQSTTYFTGALLYPL